MYYQHSCRYELHDWSVLTWVLLFLFSCNYLDIFCETNKMMFALLLLLLLIFIQANVLARNNIKRPRFFGFLFRSTEFSEYGWHRTANIRQPSKSLNIMLRQWDKLINNYCCSHFQRQGVWPLVLGASRCTPYRRDMWRLPLCLTSWNSYAGRGRQHRFQKKFHTTGFAAWTSYHVTLVNFLNNFHLILDLQYNTMITWSSAPISRHHYETWRLDLGELVRCFGLLAHAYADDRYYCNNILNVLQRNNE